jgi:hypothetical protein
LAAEGAAGLGPPPKGLGAAAEIEKKVEIGDIMNSKGVTEK